MPYNAAVLLLGLYVGQKNYNLKTYMCLMFIAALFTIARIQKQPKCPLTDAWIRIVVYDIYIYEASQS